MFTELLSMFGSPSPFKHIVFSQCSSPVLYFFSCCKWCYNAARSRNNTNPSASLTLLQSSRDLWTTAMTVTGSLILVLLGMSHVSSLDSVSSHVSSLDSDSATREILPDINHRTPSLFFLYLSLSLSLLIWGSYLIHLTSCSCGREYFFGLFFF